MITDLIIGAVESNASVLAPNGSPSALTLTVDSDTAISLNWTIGSTNHDGHRIYISTDGVNFTEEDTVLGATATYQATGLDAATIYYFYVVAYKGSIESTASNTENAETDPWTFAWFNDLHLGVAGIDEAFATTLFTAIEAQDKEFTLTCGDSLNTGTEAQYNSLVAASSVLSTPFYALKGNHDGIYLSEHFVIDKYNIRIIGIKVVSGPDPLYNGSIDAAELAWIETQMQEAGGRKIILASHHPISDQFYGYITTGGAELIALCNTYNVSLYLNGHGHNSNDSALVGDITRDINGRAIYNKNSFGAGWMMCTVYSDRVIIKTYQTVSPFAEIDIPIIIMLDGSEPTLTPITLSLTSSGTGAGTSQLQILPSESMTLTVDGNANFYTDAAGTLGESKTWNVGFTTASQTMYVKCTSGTANCVFNKNTIRLLYINRAYSATNGPVVGGSISNFTKLLRYIAANAKTSISGSISAYKKLYNLETADSANLSGDISDLTDLYVINVANQNTLTGSVAALTKLSKLIVGGSNTLSGSIAALTNLTELILAGNNTCSGSIAALTKLTTVQIQGNNTISGSIEGLTLAKSIFAEGSNTLSGSIAGLTALHTCRIHGNSTVTYPNVTAITGLCRLNARATITFTSENVNQILADFWANKDAAKPTSARIIDIAGAAGSGAPTGQGIIDKAALQAYRSPNPPGTAALWTVTTR